MEVAARRSQKSTSLGRKPLQPKWNARRVEIRGNQGRFVELEQRFGKWTARHPQTASDTVARMITKSMV